MSPEQARGAAVDKRADIWAFGVVLFEMLTGRVCSRRRYRHRRLAAVVKTEPDWSALPPGTPPRLRELLRRCLAKDRKQRLHDVGDARIELTEIATIGEQPEGPPAVATTGRRARRIALIATPAVLALAAVAVGFFLLGRGNAPPAGTPRFKRLTFREGSISNARFTPDGNAVIYSAQWEGRRPEIFESRTDGSSTSPIPGLGGFGLFSVASNRELAVGERINAILHGGGRGRSRYGRRRAARPNCASTIFDGPSSCLTEGWQSSDVKAARTFSRYPRDMSSTGPVATSATCGCRVMDSVGHSLNTCPSMIREGRWASWKAGARPCLPRSSRT